MCFFLQFIAYTYGKCSKISNTSLFCLVIRAGIQNSCLITRARIQNMLVRIANWEDLGLIWVYCLSRSFGQATSVQIVLNNYCILFCFQEILYKCKHNKATLLPLTILAYCKFGNFRENFIFANSVKRHICDVKIRDYDTIYLHK